MWKMMLAFVVFAAVALFVVMKGGDKLDMAGETSEHATTQAPAGPASASPTRRRQFAPKRAATGAISSSILAAYQKIESRTGYSLHVLHNEIA